MWCIVGVYSLKGCSLILEFRGEHISALKALVKFECFLVWFMARGSFLTLPDAKLFTLQKTCLQKPGWVYACSLKQLLWGNKVAGKPSKGHFYEICQCLEWFLQSPSSIQAIYPLTCNTEPVLFLQRSVDHLFSHHMVPSDCLNLHFSQLANLSLPCLSFDQLNHRETLLIQGFSEISLNRGQIWSENLRQENRGHSSSESINHHELSQATPASLGFPCQRWVTDKLPKAHREQKV